MAGKHYEELEIGTVFEHEVTRTITEADNVWFSAITHNTQPLHLDEEFGKQTLFGGRIVNSLFTLALVTGVGVSDVTLGTTLGNMGFTDVRFPNPVRHGDTIRATTEVIDRRESRSRPEAGLVTLRHHGFNQRDEIVCVCDRVALMLKKGES
ncbi:MaoC family dehydratase [Saccharomonospora sp. NPDC046836]|uniref:MaoC family dehydratase n=1 Tax=Saccharomonospora sp. NPDC046836 TaxID=3156921 RepID=UPI003405CDDF